MRRGGAIAISLLCGLWGCATPPEPADPLAACWATAPNHTTVGPCLRERLGQARARLDAVNHAVEQDMSELAAVTGRDTSLLAFEVSRRRFDAFREAHCTWVELRAEGGTGAGDFGLACRIRMLEARSAALESDRRSHGR